MAPRGYRCRPGEDGPAWRRPRQCPRTCRGDHAHRAPGARRPGSRPGRTNRHRGSRTARRARGRGRSRGDQPTAPSPSIGWTRSPSSALPIVRPPARCRQDLEQEEAYEQADHHLCSGDGHRCSGGERVASDEAAEHLDQDEGEHPAQDDHVDHPRSDTADARCCHVAFPGHAGRRLRSSAWRLRRWTVTESRSTCETLVGDVRQRPSGALQR